PGPDCFRRSGRYRRAVRVLSQKGNLLDMDTPSLSAADVAQFLKANPDFFDAHADIFANLMVPHPHQSRAISLGERQILLLRDRGKKTERQLATLVAN